MKINSGKVILLVITVPLSIFWLFLCGLGAFVHIHSIFEWNSRYTPLAVLSWIGLAVTLVGVFSVFRYPKITNIELLNIGIGIATMLSAIYIGPIGSFVGVINSPFLLITGLMLVSIGVFLLFGTLRNYLHRKIKG